jgi:hypothetical protein
VRGPVTFNVVGAAGRYDVDCDGFTGTFSSLASGTLTIDSLEGGHLVGSVDFTTEDGDTLSGPFDSTECPL